MKKCEHSSLSSQFQQALKYNIEQGDHYSWKKLANLNITFNSTLIGFLNKSYLKIKLYYY